MRKLVLTSETLLDLTEHEMDGIGGAAAPTGTCLFTQVVCYTIRNCPTENCTTTAVC